MNNPDNNQNQKIKGVFESKEAAEKFINNLQRSHSAGLPPNNYTITYRVASKAEKKITGNIKENDWIVIIEGKKEYLDDIPTKITEHGGFCL